MNVVQVDHVCKDYRLGEQTVRALYDVSVSIEEGVFLAIAGPSGSGKSTLLNQIGCIDTPTSGRIAVGGLDAVAARGRVKELLGYMPQRFALYPDLTRVTGPSIRARLLLCIHPARPSTATIAMT